jgi:hypothetical protein
MLARQAVENGNMDTAREIISETAKNLTYAGQYTQAARLLRDADPETLLLSMTKHLNRLNKEGAEIYGKNGKH